MKKNKIFILALPFILLLSCNGKKEDPVQGKFVRYTTDLQISSELLGTPVKYSILLPKDYLENPQKRYPVVYLLHGLGDDHKSWNDKWLNVAAQIENLENNKGLQPMIYIMPQGFRSYYVNRYDGKFPYMDMFTKEFVPRMDSLYRTVADREHRAVVGYSMGGFGAMILAAKHPEVFSVSVPLSMSFRTDEQYMTESASGWDNQWGAVFGGKGLSGTARLTDYYKQHCPYYMFTEQTVQQYAGVKYFYDCGDDEEQLLVANDNLHVQLRNINFPHEYRVRNGAHTSGYWSSAMTEALPFIVSCFDGVPYRSEEVAVLPDTLNMTARDTLLSGIASTVFLPDGYYASSAEYPAVFYIGDNTVSSDEVARALQSKTPFILITANSAKEEWISAASGTYRIDTSKIVALVQGVNGKILRANSLFLLDAITDTTLITPTNYYYITISDDGTNYKIANALYRICHAQNIPFEYRVYNGTSSKNSLLYGLLQMKSTLNKNLKL
ncbi:MAG: esterase family protein [Bacteroidales bacterium]|jgi:enterochelin esterase-like enzyme|nr:esterase family protein [Bacteroidales bacterium]